MHTVTRRGIRAGYGSSAWLHAPCGVIQGILQTEAAASATQHMLVAFHLTCLPPPVCPMCSMQPTSTPVAYTSCTARAPQTPPSTTSGSTGRLCRPRRHGRSRHRRRPRRPSGASTCRRRRPPRRPCLAVSHSNNPPCLDACACSPRCCDGLAPGPCASRLPPCNLPPSPPTTCAPATVAPWTNACYVEFGASGAGQRYNVLDVGITTMCGNVALVLIQQYTGGVSYTMPWTCTYAVFNRIEVRPAATRGGPQPGCLRLPEQPALETACLCKSNCPGGALCRRFASSQPAPRT